MLNDLVVFICMVIFGFVFVVSIAISGIYFASAKCHRLSEVMKVETKYEVISGCLLKTKTGQWVPFNNYRFSEQEQR